MKTVILILVRSAVLMGLVLFTVAVVIGRMIPDRPHVRTLESSSPVVVSQNVFHDITPEERWYFNPDTGRFDRLTIPDGDVIDHASFSPWQDDQGERLVAGRWMGWTGQASKRSLVQSGIILLSYPSGQVQKRIITDRSPCGPPCWYPGDTARLLFSAPDKRLYQVLLEGDGEELSGPQPSPLRWAPAISSLSQSLISDPYWATGPNVPPTLLVSLIEHVTDHAPSGPRPGRIWWLQLDAAGTTVVAAGPVTARRHAPLELDFCPVIHAVEGGEPMLAFLCNDLGQTRWRLCLAPITFDPATQVPHAGTIVEKKIATTARPDRPVFTPNGRSIICAISTTGAYPRSISIDVPSLTQRGRHPLPQQPAAGLTSLRPKSSPAPSERAG